MSDRSLTAEERETTITMTEADEVVRIWTAQRTVITALRKRANATEVKSGFYGTSEWAEFVVPADRFNLASAVLATRQPMSEERRALAAAMGRERQAQLREQARLLADDENEGTPEAVA